MARHFRLRWELLAILYVLFASGRIWFAPFTPVANISSSPRVLPLYAAYSLVRISIAYILSLLFALGYGFAAAKSERAGKSSSACWTFCNRFRC